MDANEPIIARLMAKYSRQEALTYEERRILEAWWQASPENRELADLFADKEWVKEALSIMEEAPGEEMWEAISTRLDEMQGISRPAPGRLRALWVRRRAVLSRLALPAATLLLFVAVCWLLSRRGEGKEKVGAGTVIAVAAGVPMEEDATWTDSSGRAIPLSTVPVGGVVARAGSEVLRKVERYALAYDAPAFEAILNDEPAPREFVASQEFASGPGLFRNCLAVGKNSSPYHLQMANGNAVWLGGGARFEYTGNRRDVAHPYALTGKALFDIAKDLGRPLVIHLPGDKLIRITGTRFFVDSRVDSSESKVALFTGQLRFFNTTDSGVQLQAGQEATAGAGGIVVRPIADSSAMMAWVDHSLHFHFTHTPFDSALAQVAAWYGLTVSNPAKLKPAPISGDMLRPGLPEGVLHNLEAVAGGAVQLRREKNMIVVSDGIGTP